MLRNGKSKEISILNRITINKHMIAILKQFLMIRIIQCITEIELFVFMNYLIMIRLFKMLKVP